MIIAFKKIWKILKYILSIILGFLTIYIAAVFLLPKFTISAEGKSQADIEVYTVNGAMGADCASTLGFSTKVVYDTAADSEKNSSSTTPEDTEAAVPALVAEHVDIILFAGGDGTARNVCQQVSNLSSQIPVLGIPAGCKIHSGVYAVTPKAAGRVIELMVSNQLVSLMTADVMDIDESLVRQGIVKAKRFGEMTIPSELRYIQAVKSGGKESDELVLQDIAADVIDNMDDEIFIIGSGSTTEFIMTELALDNTLLGVDIIQHQAVLFHDITEAKLWQFLTEQQQNNPQQVIKLVITLIGGQGHIIGRGNQQLSPRILRLIGKENIIIVATKTKLLALNEKPLIVDSGDEALDQELSGFMPITTGYHDQVLYPVASPQ
mgnify:CR=1 FL=1